MVTSDVPTHSKIVCITDDPITGAIISCYFNTPGQYFPVIAGPRMSFPHWENDVVRKRNSCAMLQAHAVILAGLDRAVVSLFEEISASLSAPYTSVVIESPADIDDAMRDLGIAELPEFLTCSFDELIFGTLLAKICKKRLRVEATAPSIKHLLEAACHDCTHKVILDDMEGVVPIIAANYAFATAARIGVLPARDFDEVRKIYDEIENTTQAPTRGERIIAEQHVAVERAKYTEKIAIDGIEFVTYMTTGVPYGCFVSGVPATHLYSNLDPGRHIADSISYAREVASTRLALIIDPGHFVESESADVSAALRSRRMVVKELIGSGASAQNLRGYIQHYPYDFLYICSHAGEIREGRRLTIKFKTRDGTEHTIVIDLAATFAPTDEGVGEGRIIEVMNWMGFVELDGVAWSDDKGKERIHAGDILKEFLEIPFRLRLRSVVKSVPTDTIREFVFIQATDGPVSIVSDFIGGAGLARPLVFNNACISLYNFSAWAIAADARGYIGTLTKVRDDKAKELARRFFALLTDDISLPVLLWQVQRAVFENPEERIYVHIGCHFNRVSSPKRDVSSYPRSALHREIQGWQKYVSQEKSAEPKENAERILMFLRKALDAEP